ncbi:MAG: hypothetical protein A3J52_00220 [Omnitrophica bacterium RIFCSPHIGHO2_02_FULL_49_9]|nr:MAG: hypothetical protein A3J52_00220 [Omnitrophica bacterium RIFCSPHIGHO2_02_FULL_49_9]OGW89901.1 MAG: hypothetical protein A3A73_01360 [Omnitrophica bacterium RIFCSPLOWO2_01_FULL_50_24]
MKKIGEILIEHGCITSEQLEQALKEQKKTPDRLIGQILINLGFVTEEDIVVALATQFNIPYLPVANVSLAEQETKLIPPELVKKYICIPIDRVGHLLTVVMADPTDEEAIKELETVTKCKVHTFVSTVSEIISAIEKHLHIKMNSPTEPSEHISKVSFRSAVQQKTERLK